MQPPGRLYACARCRAQVLICRHCDRGNRYCPGCAPEVRSARVREAGRRYQASRRGRFAHAARMRRWRASRKKVTHQGPPIPHSNDVLLADLDAAIALANAAEKMAELLTQPRCHHCGQPLPVFMRTGFIRRRGPHRVNRSDRGDLNDDSCGPGGKDPPPASC